MTDTYFTQDDLSFETLFNNGDCLTYEPLETMAAFSYTQELKKEYCKQNNLERAIIKSGAELNCGKQNPRFHYFTNGILIHNFNSKENEALQRVLTMLDIRNLAVHRIYALSQIFDYWKASDYMRRLSEYANRVRPYKTSVTVEPFPKLEEFVKDCFANGNILLTASKEENTDPNIRDCMALFADGRFYIADEYTGSGPHNDKNIKIFKEEHPSYVFLERVYVPQKYIAALYKEAKKYAWFLSVEEAQNHNNKSDAEALELERYIENLFNGRKCLSVTNLEHDPVSHFGSDPDVDKYALFSDGTLVVGNSRSNVENSYWLDQMRLIYKDLELKVERVPDWYIPEIYAALPKYQRSAATIYMERLKEKAKKLKMEFNIAHHEALDLAAKMSGWDNFQAIKVENESHARHLISVDKWRRRIAKGSISKEYELYVREKK